MSQGLTTHNYYLQNSLQHALQVQKSTHQPAISLEQLALESDEMMQ
jgi:hypothetical protein